MKEYLKAQIEEKNKEVDKWNKITGICFFGTIGVWVLFLIIVLSFSQLKERFLDFLRPKSISEILTISFAPALIIVVISIIPLIYYAKKVWELVKLKKQLKKYEAPQS